MDIKITCRTCDRTFPLVMAVDPDARPGYCPFCGEILAFQYGGTLIDTAGRVLALGEDFVRQLTLLAELAGGFSLDEGSVLAPVQNALERQRELIAEPPRRNWPPQPSEPVGR